jgi:lipid A 3-O-deacylase
MKIIPKDLAIALFAFSTAPLVGFAPAVAQTEQGFPSGIWTIQDENASISTTRPTDRYYVNGFHVGWTSNVGAVPAPIASLGHAVWGDGTQRISLGVTQQIYTPNDTQATNPPANDEPYAGYLAATLNLIQDTATTRSVLGAEIGVIGRDAGAEIVQNGFHSIIGQSGTHGWAFQLPSEPAFDILVARTWRFPLARLGNGLEVDTLPQIAAKVGTTQIYAEPAVTFRLGQGLDSDFGAPMISPGPSGSDAYQVTRPFVWYFFAGVASEFVGHDEFLQGSDFQTSRSVEPYRVVRQGDLGVAFIWHGLRFSYTQVFQTRRFYGQTGSIHEYGSFAVSARL